MSFDSKDKNMGKCPKIALPSTNLTKPPNAKMNSLDNDDNKSPTTPLTPYDCDTKTNCDPNIPIKYNAKKSLLHRGILCKDKITSTLQGSCYIGKIAKNNVDCVIKRSDKMLHNKGLAKIKDSNKYYVKVHENIVKEAKILRYLNKIKPPNGIPKIFDFIDDSRNYFIIMEHCGESFFKHVIGCHDLIENGELSLDIWNKHIKILFKQLLVIVYWLHNKAYMCHMDISLENITIKGCQLNNGNFITHGQLYLIDFGLCQSFMKKKTFKCSKFIGKSQYMAPEIVAHKSKYDARLTEIWTLGIVLLMMRTGQQPIQHASNSDANFINVINGNLPKMLKYNGHNCSKHFISIITSMLCTYKQRSNINDLIHHRYIH